MPTRLPPITYLLGVGGVIPFVGCGIAAISPGTHAVVALAALIGYAAVILSFVGAVHWGFALTAHPADTLLRPAVGTRLALGVVPSLIGWAAMLVALVALPDVALAMLIAGFIATVVIEARWARAGLVPSGYIGLRWGLSIVVVMTLVTVLALRLVGASIVF